MTTTQRFDAVTLKLMSRAELAKVTQDVREKFEAHIASFLQQPTKPPTGTVGIGRRRRPSWHMGYTHWDEHDGPYGIDMVMDGNGRIYKGPIPTHIDRLTVGQMVRAMGVLSTR